MILTSLKEKDMGKWIYLGTYDTTLEAAEAYKAAVIRIAGEFARW
jgi:hypothetical protein